MRVYMVGTKNTLIGIFSNRKVLLEALIKIGITDCHIKGSRKNLEVNEANISSYISNTGFLKIYDVLDEVKYRIWCVTINNIFIPTTTTNNEDD